MIKKNIKTIYICFVISIASIVYATNYIDNYHHNRNEAYRECLASVNYFKAKNYDIIKEECEQKVRHAFNRETKHATNFRTYRDISLCILVISSILILIHTLQRVFSIIKDNASTRSERIGVVVFAIGAVMMIAFLFERLVLKHIFYFRTYLPDETFFVSIVLLIISFLMIFDIIQNFFKWLTKSK